MFNKDIAVYGEDRPIPHREPKSKPVPPMEHDKAFKPSHPSKVGHNKTLAPFPEYKEDPRKEITRRVEPEDEKPRFKPTHNVKSRPMPSVATNMRNLKASFPSVFRK